MTHIYAYTAPGACCPEYVSIQGDDKAGAVVTVRADSVMRVSTARLSDKELLKLCTDLGKYLASKGL